MINSPDTSTPFLQTRAAANYLGLAETTLEKLRCLGGGPPFFKVSKRRIVYDRAELDAWARSKRFTSTTSEAA